MTTHLRMSEFISEWVYTISISQFISYWVNTSPNELIHLWMSLHNLKWANTSPNEQTLLQRSLHSSKWANTPRNGPTYIWISQHISYVLLRVYNNNNQLNKAIYFLRNWVFQSLSKLHVTLCFFTVFVCFRYLSIFCAKHFKRLFVTENLLPVQKIWSSLRYLCWREKFGFYPPFPYLLLSSHTDHLILWIQMTSCFTEQQTAFIQ